LAGVPFPDQVHGLLRIVDSSRLVYGSDYPFTRAPLVEALAKRVDVGLETNFGLAVKHRVLSDNAKKLLGI
jgi:predicted TIM-barrel fold metal-dependent hydrolase